MESVYNLMVLRLIPISDGYPYFLVQSSNDTGAFYTQEKIRKQIRHVQELHFTPNHKIVTYLTGAV